MAEQATVAGWIGSANLGDELVFSVLRGLLADRGIAVAAPSLNPTETASTHDVDAFGHLDPVALRRHLRATDAMVFGGGGLLQDETGIWNLPYHLHRVRSARRASTPWAGIGLGAGGLTTRLGRSQVRRALVDHTAIAVRDEASLNALTSLGIERVVRSADLVWLTNPPEPATRTGTLGVCLRAPQTTRLVPAALGPRGRLTDDLAAAIATAIDTTATATSLTTRFIAFEADADDPVHRQVADHMDTPAETHTPGLTNVLATVATTEAMITMRYHAAVAAALAGSGVVTLDFSPKLGSLAADLGPAGCHLSPSAPDGLSRLPETVTAALAARAALPEAVERLKALAARNVDVLDDLLATTGATP
ncbi:MAG TPA: polysaccharide pyruvyl transferase family protein [Chloroflexota bacterium]|nr:polysaccharide pyruvyl transferase family protein [Chloroflexota bacterium]